MPALLKTRLKQELLGQHSPLHLQVSHSSSSSSSNSSNRGEGMRRALQLLHMEAVVNVQAVQLKGMSLIERSDSAKQREEVVRFCGYA